MMERFEILRKSLIAAGMLGAASLILAGCQTAPPANWASRVGSYTYDQAVAELGPPTSTTKLANGSTVAQWAQSGHATDNTFSFTSTAAGTNASTAPPMQPGQRYLALTFDSNNILTGWQKSY